MNLPELRETTHVNTGWTIRFDSFIGLDLVSLWSLIVYVCIVYLVTDVTTAWSGISWS